MRVIVCGGRYTYLTPADTVRLDNLITLLPLTEIAVAPIPGVAVSARNWAQMKQPSPIPVFDVDPGFLDAAILKTTAGALVMFSGNPEADQIINRSRDLGLQIFDWRDQS